MVLACECGSVALSFEDQHYPENGLALERYKCDMCGRTGTFEFGEQNGKHVERMSGCVTENGVYE
jgi:transposase-like protein